MKISSSQAIWAMCLLIIMTVFLRWPVLFADLQSFGGDTVKWAGPALNFSVQGFRDLEFLPTVSYGLYDADLEVQTRYVRWPFLPSYILTGFVLTFGDSTWAVRILPLLLNIIAAVYVYLIVKDVFRSRYWGVVGATSFLLLPAGLYYSMQVADTQFWLVGSIGGFFHMQCWRNGRKRADFVGMTFWFLFACASSWFGYIAALLAVVYVFSSIVRNDCSNRFSAVLRSPVPWIASGVILLLFVHFLLLIDALGMDRVLSQYGYRWKLYTGATTDASTAMAGTWSMVIEAMRYRLDMFLNRALMQHIPLYLSTPLAITVALSAMLFAIRATLGFEPELHRSCGRVMGFFALYYLFYVLIFTAHMARGSHNFTTQMLSPIFVILLVYATHWACSVLGRQTFIQYAKYIPSAGILLLLLAMSLYYRSMDLTLPKEGARKSMIEAARLFGETVARMTAPDDLVLTNHQGWHYDNNIMRYTLRRTVMINLFSGDKIESYISDSKIKGVVFIYSEKRKYDHEEPFIQLKGYLQDKEIPAYLIDDEKAYHGLTLYRLK